VNRFGRHFLPFQLEKAEAGKKSNVALKLPTLLSLLLELSQKLFEDHVILIKRELEQGE
jgi:hypothetical protein